MSHSRSPKLAVRDRVGVRPISAFTRKWVVRVGLGAALGSMAVPRISTAEDLALPAEVEARLSGSVAAYDRTLANRAGPKVVTAILTNPADSDSVRAGSQMQDAFREVERISGLPHEEFVLPWKSGSALVEACVRGHAAIVFVSPGLDNELGAIVQALEHLGVLTIAGSLPYVKRGLVLGFDLVSGRPKVVINLTMAKRQGLAFQAALLRLAQVVE